MLLRLLRKEPCGRAQVAAQCLKSGEHGENCRFDPPDLTAKVRRLFDVMDTMHFFDGPSARIAYIDVAPTGPDLHEPILLIHGEADETIPVEAMFQSAEDLGGAGIPAQWHLSRGVGHGIDGGGLTHGGMFLAHAFGVKPPTR